MNRLKALQKKRDELFLAMELFCLSPELQKFNEICNEPAILRKIPEEFKIWRLACLYKYGREWELTHDPADNGRSIEIIEYNFELWQEKLCRDAIEKPSVIISTQILYMFFATGELKYIDLYYQCMGHKELVLESRRHLVSLYREAKDEYQKAVDKLLHADRNYFESRDINQSVVDFSYFDDAKEKAVREKKYMEDQIKLQNSLQSN